MVPQLFKWILSKWKKSSLTTSSDSVIFADDITHSDAETDTGSFRKEESLLYSHIIYRSYFTFTTWINSGVFDCGAKTHLDKLNVIQRITARIILQVSRASHAQSLLDILLLQSLEERRKNPLLTLIHSIVNSTSHSAFDNLFVFEDHHSGELLVPYRKSVMETPVLFFSAIQFSTIPIRR